MGKAAKTRRSEQRKKEKRSRKMQQQALYQSFTTAGTNKKTKRNATGQTIKVNKHQIANCGNQGCERCFPHLALQRMSDSTDPRVRFRTTAQQKADGLF